jgi:hypothetical protein
MEIAGELYAQDKELSRRTQHCQRMAGKRHGMCESASNEFRWSFPEEVQFSDEATLNVSGAVNRRNVRIWGSENPHAYVQHQRDSPKVNVFCAISSQKVYGPFFFSEETVTGMAYLDMLQLLLMPQL